MKRINAIVAVLALSCVVTSAQNSEANKKVLSKWVEAIWQDHDRDYIAKNSTGDFPVEAYEAWFDSITTTYPDARVETLHMLAEGDEVALHWEFTGTSALEETEERERREQHDGHL